MLDDDAIESNTPFAPLKSMSNIGLDVANFAKVARILRIKREI